VRAQGAGMGEQDGRILRLRDQIPIDPLLLIGAHLQGEKIDFLAPGLLPNQRRDKELWLGERMDITQEYDLMLAERRLDEFKRGGGFWDGGKETQS
jgi:hypothetical protein